MKLAAGWHKMHMCLGLQMAWSSRCIFCVFIRSHEACAAKIQSHALMQVMFLYLVGGAVGSAAFLYQEYRQLPSACLINPF